MFIIQEIPIFTFPILFQKAKLTFELFYLHLKHNGDFPGLINWDTRVKGKKLFQWVHFLLYLEQISRIEHRIELNP